MLDFDTAQSHLAARGHAPKRTETLPLDQLTGRVLARDILASLDLPPADNSAMDGYAVRLADLTPLPRTLPVQQRCFAGQIPEALRPGQAIRLFTGSIIPEGADTVIMQEDTHEDDAGVTFNKVFPKGQHIRRQGDDMRQGNCILPQGSFLQAGQIAALAAQGLPEAEVYPKLTVGILTTGDELIAPGKPLRASAIYNSNAAMLASLCQGMNTAPALVRHAPDDTNAIQQAIADLHQQCDLVLSVGGASVGEKDLVKPAIEALGGTLDLWRVRMKPGKPVALAELHQRPMVCLPGNPVSAFVVFTLLVSPLIRGLQGRQIQMPVLRRGILQSGKPMGGERDDFIRVQAAPQAAGLPHLVPHAQQSSGALSSLGWANGLARIPAGTKLEPGAEVVWYAFNDWLI
ncbi:gephyrin-like molybdotransferase Glp [Castellaniella sp.]|uniref:molybdopterin molybdotransferase MoeA n=1 Tax=Castellaniella sp. TaxID=1955812 RepID=UPI003A8EBC16